MNALFLKDLAQKTRRGLEGRIRQGKSGGGLCFGYDIVRSVDPAGEPVHGERRINQIEAAIVRRVFEEFAKGRLQERSPVPSTRRPSPVPPARPGDLPRSMATGGAAPGFSTTSYILVDWSGTVSNLSRIPIPVGARRG